MKRLFVILMLVLSAPVFALDIIPMSSNQLSTGCIFYQDEAGSHWAICVEGKKTPSINYIPMVVVHTMYLDGRDEELLKDYLETETEVFRHSEKVGK